MEIARNLILRLSIFFLSFLQCSYLLASNDLIVLTYHDIVDTRSELVGDAVTSDHLVGHFEWLKLQGYHVVSLDDLKAAQDGVRPLPRKAVLLTWDDGYTSFYTHVLPLLKAYNYPAVLAIVGSWMEPKLDGFVQYGASLVPREKFMSWEEVKEAKDSGLVEIASHSYDLHKGIAVNRFGDRIPAAVARKFDFQTKKYETDEQYRERIRNDLQMASDQIYKHLRGRPRAIVWPYGYYNMETIKIASEFGMDITMNLNYVSARDGKLQEVGRAYLSQNPDVMVLRGYLEEKKKFNAKHFVRVDSRKFLEIEQMNNSYIEQQEKKKFLFPVVNTGKKYEWLNYNKKRKNYKGIFNCNEDNLSLFLDKMKSLYPDIVIIDPVLSSEKGIEALFPNSRYPLAQNRLNRICWKAEKRIGVPIFLWFSSKLFMQKGGETGDTVNRFFADMGKFAPVRGIVIDNPKLLVTFFNRDTQKILEKQSMSIAEWNPSQRRAARQHIINHGNKEQAEMLQPLESFQNWQPFLEVSCVISTENFRQMSLKDFSTLLKVFDFLIVNVGNKKIKYLQKSMENKILKLKKSGLLQQISFLLSAEEGKRGISEEFQQLLGIGIASWGYQFDDFHNNSPRESDVYYFMSKKYFPYPLNH